MSDIYNEKDSEIVSSVDNMGNLDGYRQSKVMSTISLCFIFALAYFVFECLFFAVISTTYLVEMINSNLEGLIDSLSDAGLLLLAILYCFIIFSPLGFFGFIMAKRISRSLVRQIIIILPIVIVGILLWYTGYSSSSRNINDLQWILYYLYAMWGMTIISGLEDYVSNPGILVYLSLAAVIIPCMAFLIGVWADKYLTRYVTRNKIKLVAVGIPFILVLCIFATVLIPKATMFTAYTYPRVDGATAAIPFGKVLIKELAGASKRKANKVSFSTTHDAYVNLIEKKADIIFVAGPSDEELKLAEQNNVKMKLTPIGRDAFIFLVHKDNPVNDLTIKQIQDIYSGKVTNWKQVGGADNEMLAYQREKNSGSQTFMENKVMKGISFAEAPTEKKPDSMGGLIDAVADYKNAKNSIGYSFYYFANEMHKRESVKFLSIEGIECNKENITSKKYPFTAVLYAVTREGEAPDSSASKMLQWILGDEGTQAIEEGGFVPMSK
ncbi:MAG TPA: substrate-binding domain-containing protein [Pseudobacteroides sp.]|uniref:PstS family phosphate ABC transporter substrate-binding protein n=1 Tax=Pseudobacteroides sp. TaxID=1968840 RepID=UPI002F938E17